MDVREGVPMYPVAPKKKIDLSSINADMVVVCMRFVFRHSSSVCFSGMG
jgi:hypothetical protein